MKASPPTPEPGVWQQFRRRRVTRTSATYLAVAFALAEATLYLSPRLGLPGTAFRVVAGGLVLGFPFAVVLAWRYDVTEDGIVRTPDDLDHEVLEVREEPTRLRFLGVLAVWVLLGAVFWLLRG